MGIWDCRGTESSSKRRKVCKSSMRMDRSSSEVLGPKGLIRKNEFVRVIIQCLSSLGYENSASCLESESCILYKCKEFQELKSQLLDANWEECISTLNGIEDLTDETRSSALFLVFKQHLLECLRRGDDAIALNILQKRVAALNLGEEKVHDLALNMLSAKNVGNGEMNNGTIHKLHKKLLVELENLMPPPITVPERRLEYLVETAVTSQIDSCLYHNSSGAINLYEDHCCGRDQIPTETFQVWSSLLLLY